MERAAAVELPAMALVDVNGVYGAPRFYQAARRTGVRALVGAEVVLSPEAFFAWGEGTRGLREVLRRAGKRGPLGLVPEPPAWSTAAVPLVNAADTPCRPGNKAEAEAAGMCDLEPVRRPTTDRLRARSPPRALRAWAPWARTTRGRTTSLLS